MKGLEPPSPLQALASKASVYAFHHIGKVGDERFELSLYAPKA